MNKPIVGIIMGSDSDLPYLQRAAETLEKFDISYEIKIISAHRTPELMDSYAQTAAKRGLKVIIAGAGGSAHLPGMTASLTTLPVIGVPIITKALEGLDSLLSIVQMPPGIPVATMGINGAINAGLMAIKILAVSDETLTEKLAKYMENLEELVIEKSDLLEKLGYKEYLKQK